MFEELLRGIDRLEEGGLSSEIPGESALYLPPKFSLRDILSGVIQREEANTSANHINTLRALQSCLESNGLISDAEDDPTSVKEISHYVVNGILPVASDSEEATATWKSSASSGELGLSVLKRLCDKIKISVDAEGLLAVAAYTNAQDPWTSPASAAIAKSILDGQLTEPDAKANFIASNVLSQFLRPLFSKSRPATVTASGRKAEFVENVRFGGAFNGPSEPELKPWKHGQQYAISIFEWAVTNSDPDILSKHWHLYTPVLLTLLDEPQTDIKVRALQIFSAFWEQCPNGQIANVGLAEVFEQTIFPAVLYLPTITPEDESIKILNAAYPALFQIAGLGYPEEEIGEPVQQPAFAETQRKLLDKIIRQGILVGYRHANEHIQLTEVFCKKAKSIINGMGILAVKHLKDLIPMISEIMTDPFGTNYPPTLLAAAELLRTIMRCCWPRITDYSNEIIRTLTVCFLNVEDEDNFPGGKTSQEELRSALTQTAEVLSAILDVNDISLSDTISPLIETEPLLSSLFITKKSHLGVART